MVGRGPWLVMLLLVAALPPAAAENPRISVKLESATFAEAAAALSRTSGIPVQHWSARLPAGLVRRPEPLLNEKASFDWTNVTFSIALRQLCDRYNLQPSPSTGGVYVLNPAGARPAPPARLAGLVEKNGIRLYARSVDIYTNRSRRLDFLRGATEGTGGSTLYLSISGAVPGGDADTIAGFENVVARDDMGGILLPAQRPSPTFGRSSVGPFPDEWTIGIVLPGPHPKAKRLAWVEGDLMVYRLTRRHHLEFTLPLTEGRKRVGDAVVELSRYDPGDREDTGPTVQMQVDVPSVSAIRPDGYQGSIPLLVGASGRIYLPGGSSFGGGGGTSGYHYRAEGSFQPIDEPLVKVLFQLVERSQPERLCTVRMEGIPLPPEVVLAAPRPAPHPVNPPPPVRAPSTAGSDRPYFQQGGGILVSKVEPEGRAAVAGTLALGLSLKTSGGWSSIRWIELELGKDGQARLADLKPGTYRILRVFRPREVPKVTGNGRWVDGEVVVDVIAGKEVVLPPLRWAAEAAAPAEKPRR
jgi:hypothetical protein